MASERPVAIFLMGPTASGKTDLAIQLCQTLPCEIVSVDSALIYRGMDIGTAKPTQEELKKAPHRLIDIVDPWESYSVARFYNDALTEMQEITKAGRIPLLVGGTMMYFRILRDGIAEMPSADEQVREQILADAEKHGWSYIHAQLAEIDPVSAERIKPTDPQRLQRALEVYRVSGKTLTELWQAQQIKGQEQQNGKAHHNIDDSAEEQTGKGNKADYTIIKKGLPPIPYDIVNLAIAPAERSELHDRIARRFRMMLEDGFLEEVERFFKSGKLDGQMPSMRCVGYRQAWDYFAGRLDYDEMIERGIIATRQLAKRQLTWLRSWPDLNWVDTGDEKKLEKVLKIVKQSTF